ncbi:MAG: GntR family transcriptional regulator [Sphingomonas sp.]
MSPAHVLEPTYLAIKERLKHGRWPAGLHLDTARLADALGVSKSPVRDSLNRLAGERMVHFEPGAGFQVPRLDEKQLHDMLELNLSLLVSAVQRLVLPAWPLPAQQSADAAQRFLQLAQASGNGEITAAVAGLNDRLAAIRLLDPIVLSEPDVDLYALDRALAASEEVAVVATILGRYHAARRRHAGDYARLLAAGIRHDAAGHPTHGSAGGE